MPSSGGTNPIEVSAEAIKLNQKSSTLRSGKRITLTATITPSNTVNKTVTWKSSNGSVAQVDQNGVVTAHNAGQTIITATTANGHTATCTVIVP